MYAINSLGTEDGVNGYITPGVLVSVLSTISTYASRRIESVSWTS